MTKIVINACYGGFGLSPQAIVEYLKLKGKQAYFYRITNHVDFKGHKIDNPLDRIHNYNYISTLDLGDWFVNPTDELKPFTDYNIKRDDPDLIKVVETLGEAANSYASELKIVEIPDDINWDINDCDGHEWIAEKHRIWR